MMPASRWRAGPEPQDAALRIQASSCASVIDCACALCTATMRRMTFDAPRAPRPAEDERELLLGYVGWQREQVVATANGLTDEQLRWRPDDKLLPIGGLLNHPPHHEWR